MNWMPEAIRDGIIVVLVISGPLVLAAAFIGLIIGILQAATQVQEQTIGSALKIIGVFALVIAAGFWMFQYLNQYTSRTLSSAFTIVPNQTQKVIPKEATIYEEQAQKETPSLPFIQKVPEKEETKIPTAGIPSLGAPQAPQAPKTTQIVTPNIPINPPKIVKPEIPSLQEQNTIGIPQTETNQNDQPLINLVPGNPINSDNETSLWERTEITQENGNNETRRQEEIPSWLD